MKKISKKIITYGLTILTIFSTSFVFAESVPGTDFSVHFESANIVGTGRSINMHRVPVVSDITGETQFYDVSFKLSLDADNQLIFDGFSQITSPSINSADNFIPGTYQDGEGNKYTLTGPSVVGNGRTGWALSTTSQGESFTCSWITGAASGHPAIGSRSITSELPEGFSYGVQGTNGTNSSDFRYGWKVGKLIGAQQIGNTLVLSRFHVWPNDQSTPSASINLMPVTQ
jgi:hypothetical protein